MKYRIKTTGEIVQVIRYGYTGDFTVYVDAQGKEHNERLNFFTDFEEVEEEPKEIDWEQRRYEIASRLFTDSCKEDDLDYLKSLAEYSIKKADILIDILKGK